jgi:hypothetical protein
MILKLFIVGWFLIFTLADPPPQNCPQCVMPLRERRYSEVIETKEKCKELKREFSPELRKQGGDFVRCEEAVRRTF